MYRCDKCHVPPHVKVTRHARRVFDCHKPGYARVADQARIGGRSLQSVCGWIRCRPEPAWIHHRVIG